MLNASFALFIFIRCYMIKKSILIFLFFAVITLMGCQQQRIKKTIIENDSFIRVFETLKFYKVRQLELDYSAKCRIRIKTPTLDQSGSCQIVLTRDNHLRITVFSPIGGTLLIIYQDDVQIQVLNYYDKTYLHLTNNEVNRNKAFEIINLNVPEFRSIFWGREIEEEDTQLQFRYKGGKPDQIRKSKHHADQLVRIKTWLPYQGTWFPRTIEFEERLREIFLKVVITSFSPGLIEKPLLAETPEDFQIRQ